MRSFSVVLLAMVILMACGTSLTSQDELKSALTGVREQHQLYRLQMDSVAKIEGWQSPTIQRLYEGQRKLDSVNLAEVEEIIDRYGYPRKDLVGELARVPFEVIRHSGDSVMINYSEIILDAGINGDLPMDQVASFYDQILVAQRQPQEYGTQVWIDFIENKKTGVRYDSLYLWPVRNYTSVDARRISAGLDSLANHLRRYNIDPAKGYVLKKSGGAPL
ncbi:MAG: hypothetical protein JNN04_17615 [Cyclobacteriaceae bacterium]|nr:hypothetical protein [Cyclobacteriaceae bacterium]